MYATNKALYQTTTKINHVELKPSSYAYRSSGTDINRLVRRDGFADFMSKHIFVQWLYSA